MPVLNTSLKYCPTAAIVGLIGVLFLGSTHEPFATIAVTVLTAVLIATVRPGDIVYRALTLRPMIFIGLISYSLYLWHWSVIVISRWTIGVFWWSAPFLVAAMFALAYSSYHFVEKPLRRAEWSSSKLRTIAWGAATSAAVALLCLILGEPLKGALYVGRAAPLEAQGVATIGTDKIRNGRVVWSPQRCSLMNGRDAGKSIASADCTLPVAGTSSRRFLVIGNSYSSAQLEMFEALAIQGIGSVTVTSSFGAAPVPDVPSGPSWARANQYYWQNVIPSLLAELKRGDFVIMANDLAERSPQFPSAESSSAIDLIGTGLTKIAKDLEKKGVDIIFQAAIPFLRESNCSPDMTVRQWFNPVAAPVCTYFSKIASRLRRQKLQDVLLQVEAKQHNFRVLDLFDMFCPGQTCTYTNDDGVFLYRDSHSHPSIEANRLAAPLLVTVVRNVIAAEKTARAP